MITVGCVVKLKGLVSAKKMNGKFGIVKERIKETGRFAVEVNGVMKHLREINMEYMFNSK